MPAPDIGLAPPPPPDVASQLKPSAPGGMDLGGLLAGLTGGASPGMSADVTPKVLEVQPFLDQIARQVPALGPDVDRLNVELKSRMGGLPTALAGMAGPMPGMPGMGGMGEGVPPVAGGGPPPAGPMPVAGPPAIGAGAPPPPPAPMAAIQPAGPMAGGPVLAPPTPPGTMGAMDTAMQLEMKLPPIGKDDPTLMPYIQGFIARMRVEVPKVVSGETEAITPPVQATPTEAMMSKIPVSY